MAEILAVDLGKFKSVTCLLKTETNETEFWTMNANGVGRMVRLRWRRLAGPEAHRQVGRERVAGQGRGCRSSG